MMRPAHTITLHPWRSLSLGERAALETVTALLWPLKDDDRMTVLINLMAAQISNMVENEDQIDALIDVLRMQLKLSLGESRHDADEPSRKLSRNETHDLSMIIKDRTKVLRAHAEEQAAACMADFERQMATSLHVRSGRGLAEGNAGSAARGAGEPERPSPSGARSWASPRRSRRRSAPAGRAVARTCWRSAAPSCAAWPRHPSRR